MSDLFEDLKQEKSDNGNWIVFADEDVKAKANEVIPLDGGGLLAVRYDAEQFHISFAVFDFHSGPATKDGVEVDGAKWNCVFRGSGPSGSLRELRHTYWGEPDHPGYVFYPNAKVIGDAFAKLKRWFDCD